MRCTSTRVAAVARAGSVSCASRRYRHPHVSAPSGIRAYVLPPSGA